MYFRHITLTEVFLSCTFFGFLEAGVMCSCYSLHRCHTPVVVHLRAHAAARHLAASDETDAD